MDQYRMTDAERLEILPVLFDFTRRDNHDGGSVAGLGRLDCGELRSHGLAVTARRIEENEERLPSTPIRESSYAAQESGELEIVEERPRGQARQRFGLVARSDPLRSKTPFERFEPQQNLALLNQQVVDN